MVASPPAVVRRLRPVVVGIVAAAAGTAAAVALAAEPQILTIAGNGETNAGPVGGPAIATPLRPSFGVAVAPDGRVLVAEPELHQVRVIRPDGTLEPFAGTGSAGAGGDGGPAAQAELHEPFGVAAGADGAVYVTEGAGSRVRRVAPDGTISTVAGTGTRGFSGDGGPATAAELSSPLDVLPLPDGSLLIADAANHRIRRVAPGGTISTWAGTGEPTCADAEACSLGDGGPATAGRLSAFALALAPDGAVLVADKLNRRVRRISRFGSLTTFAGTSEPQGDGIGTGDGGPATDATFLSVEDVAVTPQGDVVVADAFARRLRRVGPDRAISAFAGTGEPGFSGDGGPPLQARFSFPDGVAAAPDGAVLAVDSSNYRIRRIGPAAPPPPQDPGTTSTPPGPGETVTITRTVTVPGPAAPPPRTASPPRVTVTGRLRAKMLGRPGAVSITCRRACSYRVELRDARGRTLATATGRRSSPGTARPALRVTRAGRAAARTGRPRRATVVVVVRDPGGAVALRRVQRVTVGA